MIIDTICIFVAKEFIIVFFKKISFLLFKNFFHFIFELGFHFGFYIMLNFITQLGRIFKISFFCSLHILKTFGSIFFKSFCGFFYLTGKLKKYPTREVVLDQSYHKEEKAEEELSEKKVSYNFDLTEGKLKKKRKRMFDFSAINFFFKLIKFFFKVLDARQKGLLSSYVLQHTLYPSSIIRKQWCIEANIDGHQLHNWLNYQRKRQNRVKSQLNELNNSDIKM
jgi:hypothetical protein